MGLVTLLTDFGTRDGFVGALKGVLATRAPSAVVQDVGHDLPRGDVRKASFVLARYWRWYPEGTVHLVVVDPGVGTSRKGLGVEADGRLLVLPDNGIISEALREATSWRAVSLRPLGGGPPSSMTFHGRDLFAPAAAELAAGVDLRELGDPLESPFLLPPLPLSSTEEGLEGVVQEVDRFGNLATNLPPDAVRDAGGVIIGGQRVKLRATYGEGAPGEPLALVNSDGRIEIAVRDGSAADRLRVGPGARVLCPRSR